MAQLTISAKEILDFAQMQNYLPDRIQDVQLVGNEIHSKWKVLGSIQAYVILKITDYSAGILILTIKTEGLIGAIAVWASSFFKLRNDNIELNMPELKININQLIHKYFGSLLNENGLNNFSIDDVRYHDCQLKIRFSV